MAQNTETTAAKGSLINDLKEWTVMVYMSSDNTLSSECVWALTEMQNSNLPDQIAVVAQFDPPGKGIGTKRYDFTGVGASPTIIPTAEAGLEEFEIGDLTDERMKRALFIPLAKRKIYRPIEENFADAAVLEDFVGKAIKRYPAKHYLVVLSGFGNGPTGGLLTDENPPGSMSIATLKIALENIKNGFTEYLTEKPQGEIDILGLDSCLMGMAEVVSELSGTVGYLVASEGTIPGTGWPYRQILENIQSSDPEEVAGGIVDNFLRFYSDYIIAGVSVDQSVCNLAYAKSLETATYKLVKALADELPNGEWSLKEQFIDRLTLAHWKAQTYRFEQHVDLWDFCSCLKASLTDTDKEKELKSASEKAMADEEKELKSACERVIAAVATVVLKTDYVGASFQHSHGLSIYFPWSLSETEAIREYSKLLFPLRTKWGEFLMAYVKDTQRKVRGVKYNGQLSIFPQDVLFPDRDNPRLSDVRDNPRLSDVRDNPRLSDVRDNPPIGDVRDNPPIGDVRDNPRLSDVRDLFGGGGLIVLASKVKNPPTHFYNDSLGSPPVKQAAPKKSPVKQAAPKKSSPKKPAASLGKNKK